MKDDLLKIYQTVSRNSFSKEDLLKIYQKVYKQIESVEDAAKYETLPQGEHFPLHYDDKLIPRLLPKMGETDECSVVYHCRK